MTDGREPSSGEEVMLPPLRDVISEHGLGAQKSLGQHFLLDLNITRKIAALTEAGPAEHIWEVGPGPGGLTRALLETGAHVTTVERDARIEAVLTQLKDAYPDQLTSIQADALSLSEEEHVTACDMIIASNLPYNISTELLVKWLTARPRWWRRMVLMFQREVGERIIAQPGNKTYGRLSVLAQILSKPRLGFHLPARAFTPPPKVASSVLVFDNADMLPTTPKFLEKVTAAAFGQRRKMIRTTLKPLFGDALEGVLNEHGIAPDLRAEQLPPVAFVALATHLSQMDDG